MDNLKIKGAQDRSKINMHELHEVQYWTKHLKVSKEQLQKAVDKVGNAAAAVRKELAAKAVIERAVYRPSSKGRAPRVRPHPPRHSPARI